MLDLDALTVVELDKTANPTPEAPISTLSWPYPLLRLHPKGKILWMSKAASQDLKTKGVVASVGQHIENAWSIEGGFNPSRTFQLAQSSKTSWTFYMHATETEILITWTSLDTSERNTEKNTFSYQEQIQDTLRACRKLVLHALVLLQREDLAAVQQTLLKLDGHLEIGQKNQEPDPTDRYP
jgi:hypothetical protein